MVFRPSVEESRIRVTDDGRRARALHLSVNYSSNNNGHNMQRNNSLGPIVNRKDTFVIQRCESMEVDSSEENGEQSA